MKNAKANSTGRKNVISGVEKDGFFYMPIKPLTEVMKLDWRNQLRMINNDAVLKQMRQKLSIKMHGKTQEMDCLPVEFVCGWLFRIQLAHFSREQQEKIVKMRKWFGEVSKAVFKSRSCGPQPEMPSVVADEFDRVAAFINMEVDAINSLYNMIQDLQEEVKQLKSAGTSTCAGECGNSVSTCSGKDKNGQIVVNIYPDGILEK